MTRRIAALVLVATLLGAPTSGVAGSRNVFERSRDVVADLVLARPLGLVQLASGVVLFPVLLPHELLTRADVDLVRVCLTDPARHVFARPLGAL